MNPQHLMPGNYILYNGREVIVTPQLLITMQSPCKCKLFSPIELTDQWLDDFKFKKINGLNYQLDDFVLLANLKTKNIVFRTEFNKDVVLKYIHQLQILYFALTHKQLTK